MRTTLGDEPAFPQTDYFEDEPVGLTLGMTKREYCAIAILAGLTHRAMERQLTNISMVEAAVKLTDRLFSKLAEADRGDA